MCKEVRIADLPRDVVDQVLKGGADDYGCEDLDWGLPVEEAPTAAQGRTIVGMDYHTRTAKPITGGQSLLKGGPHSG